MSKKKKRINFRKWTDPAFAGKFTTSLWWELKCESYDTIEKVFCYLSKFNDVKKKKLSKNLFPSSYSQLDATKAYRDNSNTTIAHQSFFGCSIIKLYSNEINIFLRYKSCFENALFQNDYEECHNYIKKINSEISVSLWSIQNELLLGQLDKNLEGNKTKLKELRAKGLRTNTDILSGLYSHCLEEKVTTEGFETALNEKFNQWGAKYSIVCAYFSFILNRTNFKDIDKTPSILQYACSNSIIDLYENTVSCLISLVSGHNEKLIPSRIKKLINEIAQEVNDDRWCLLSNYINPENLHLTSFHKETLIPVLESYSAEEYDDIISKGKFLINKFPLCLDFYDIYCKALMSSNLTQKELNEHLQITKHESMVNEITSDYYHIVMKNAKTSGALLRMLKKTKILSTSSFSDRLYSFCIRHSLFKNEFDLNLIHNRGLINGCGGTPKFSNVFPTKKSKEHYIKKFKNVYGDLLCLKPYKFQVKKTSGDQALSSREKFYLAKILFSDEEYNETIHLLENLIDKEFVCFHRERIIKLLLRSYCKIGTLEKELVLLSNTIIENKHLLHTVDIKDFFSRIRETSMPNSSLALDKAILIDYYLKNAPDGKNDNFERYSAYIEFLELLNINTPSDLFSDPSKIKDLNPAKLKYFFRFVCCSETLEDDWHFENIIERENERVRICDYLNTIDPKNSEYYQKETLEISRNAEIRKFLRKLDKSRIFVETNKIIETTDDHFKEKCDRLLSLINLPKDLRQVKDFSNKDLKSSEYKNQINYKDGAFEIFQYLFTELVELFVLHDEYGLDSFLSGRIRHGVFDTEIRSVFEMNNLVTKSEDGEYLRNNFWLEGIANSKADLAFNELSKKVDEQLTFVIQNWIQVSTKSELKYIQRQASGLLLLYLDKKVFDFSFSSIEMEKYYKDLQDIQDVYEFCEFAFDILWKRANSCLKTMRSLIQNNLQKALLEDLEILEKETINEKAIDKERLISNIHSCRGQLIRKLEEVSKWFRLSKTLTYENYQLENLLNSCISIFNNRNSIHFVASNIYCNENRIYHARTFLPLIEIMLIKLGNIVKHAPNKISTTIISANINNGYLKISTQNDLPDDNSNREDLKIRIERALKTYDPSALRREGRTGFHKMKNIIRNHFDPENTSFKCQIKGDSYFFVETTIPEEVLLA